MSLISFIKSMLGASVDHTSVSPKNESPTQSSEEKAVYRGLLNKKTKKELSLKMNISTNEVNTITKKVKSDLKATLLAKGYMPSKA